MHINEKSAVFSHNVSMTSSATLFGRRLALRLTKGPSRGWARLAVVVLLLSLLGGCGKHGVGEYDPGSVDTPLCNPQTAQIGARVYSEHYASGYGFSPKRTYRHSVFLQAIDEKKGVLRFNYMRKESWYPWKVENSRKEESIVTHRLSEGRVMSYRAFRKVEGALEHAMEPVDIHIHEVTDTTLRYELRPAPGANFQLKVNDKACG